MDQDPNAGTSGTMPKRARMECMIHSPSVAQDSNLVLPQSIESWESLLRAAQIRRHKLLIDLGKDLPDSGIPQVAYHRTCRSLFTMKKALDAILSNENKSEETTYESSTRKSARQAPQAEHKSRVYEARCIFCEKATKYLKRSRTRDVLTQCSELRADEKVRKAAVMKLDDRILALLSRELVAAEGHYHRSCYHVYTKDADGETSHGVDESQYNTDNSVQYDTLEKQAYSNLFHYLREELFVNPTVVPLTDITHRLILGMNALGVTELKSSTKKHIRRKLEGEFGVSLHFIPDDKGKLLVYPDNLSICELAKAYQVLQAELQTLKSTSTEAIIDKAALRIRSDIKSQDDIQEWPPQIENNEINIPVSVTRFLYILLSGTADCADPSQRVQRLAKSFGQDLIFAVTVGKTKPLKHITLPFAVKSLTGNVELVRTLNRLGHSVSYTQIEEIDTALALQKLSLAEGGVAVPRNIHSGVFTTLAWDNIDRLEETLSGEGTSHRVNGIAVQAKVIGHQPVMPLPCIEKKKQRTITTEPLMLPTYNAGERVGPPTNESVDIDTTSAIQKAKEKNFLWLLARMSQPEAQSVSSWTGFNILIRDEVTVVKDNIGYLPTINAPAPQMSTVNEVLNKSLMIMQSLELDTIVCVFDQALYAKAAEVVWKHTEKFSGIIIRLGVFHTICTLLSTIGKRFQDAGLRDICVEANVIADGSIAGVMEGRKYNRAVRLHKLLYEAFIRLAWKGFLQWLEKNHSENLVEMEETLEAISNLCEDVSQAAFQDILKNKSCACILKLFDVYRSYLRQDNGSLSAFWMSYVDMVEILLGLIRASREGDWMLHLASIRAMIPWCFAYDKLNYARYLPHYYTQMSRLAMDHPDVYSHFMQGGFSVQIGPRNPFGRIPVDQAIEETANKDTQTPGGTKGFSLKSGAVSRYYLTSEYRSSYLRQLRNMTEQDSSQKLYHPDLQLPRIKKDEADIKAFVELMENSWINPLSHEQTEIVSLSTGIVAPPEIASDLLRAQDVGEETYQNFKKYRLEREPPTVKFYDKMKKQNLKTFSNIKRKHTVGKDRGKQVVLKADRNLFGHMVIAAQSRQLDIKDVLAHPLGPLPWALSNCDGSLRKTNKSALARELEKNVSPAEAFPKPSSCIIDGMSLIQKLKGDGKTFAQLAESALTLALHEGAQSERIDVVFDVYWDTSIKNAERCQRGSALATQWKEIAPGHKIQQWRQFLSNSQNKMTLIKFLVRQWNQPDNREKLQDISLYVTCGEACYHITKDHCVEIQVMKSTQEEADTRLLLHAMNASEQGYKSVIITAEDTDVLILCLGFSKKISCPLYQKCGTQNRTRYIDIGKLASSLGEGICQGLIGLHALTGCDTVSAFAGRGKLSALKHFKGNEIYQEAFAQLGETWDVSAELFQQLESFVCQMYVSSTTIHNVNALRYHMFCVKRGEVESSQLPPCKDCLHMHVLRANYQAAIWRRCLENEPIVPDPKSYGWITDDDGSLSIEWMRGSPAPDTVLQLMSCKCVRTCKLPDCTCLANQLKCTDMCKLQTCTNQRVEDNEESEVELDDSDEDEYGQ